MGLAITPLLPLYCVARWLPLTPLSESGRYVSGTQLSVDAGAAAK